MGDVGGNPAYNELKRQTIEHRMELAEHLRRELEPEAPPDQPATEDASTRPSEGTNVRSSRATMRDSDRSSTALSSHHAKRRGYAATSLTSVYMRSAEWRTSAWRWMVVIGRGRVRARSRPRWATMPA